MWGAYFCMGSYKRNVVVVTKMGAYIYGVQGRCVLLLVSAAMSSLSSDSSFICAHKLTYSLMCHSASFPLSAHEKEPRYETWRHHKLFLT